jgi:hypothetical protein
VLRKEVGPQQFDEFMALELGSLLRLSFGDLLELIAAVKGAVHEEGK